MKTVRRGETEASAEPERRPAFARDFPRSPGLDGIVEAFARGNYARVRRDAAELERTTEDESIRSAARTLVERTKPDPLAVGLLAIAALLLALVGGWWMALGKAPAADAPSTSPTARVPPTSGTLLPTAASAPSGRSAPPATQSH